LNDGGYANLRRKLCAWSKADNCGVICQRCVALLSQPNDFDQIVLHLPRDLLEKSAPGGLNHTVEKLNAGNPFTQAILALAPQLLRITTTAPTVLAQRAAAALLPLPIEQALAIQRESFEAAADF
jgi:hypothetical protein